MVEDDGHGPVASDGEVVLEAVPVEEEAVDPAVMAQEAVDQAVVGVDPVAEEAEDTLLQTQKGQDIILIQPRSSGLNRT